MLPRQRMTMPTALVGIVNNVYYYLLRLYGWPAVVVTFGASFLSSPGAFSQV